MAADTGAPERRWDAHPWRARALRLLVYALPTAGSLGFVRLLTAFVAVPTASLWVYLAWWLGISLAATLVVTALYSLTRRLLPIGLLLNLSLVFPDEAPSRFKLAMSTGTVETLEARLALMREAREAPNAQKAAEILLQLVAALDVYDVITSARSYKEASNASDARAEIARCAGTQFDPGLVREFVNISLGRMRLVMGPVSWLSHAPLLARLPLTPSIASALGGLASLATAATLGVAAPHAKADAATPRQALAPPTLKQSTHRERARPRHRQDGATSRTRHCWPLGPR